MYIHVCWMLLYMLYMFAIRRYTGIDQYYQHIDKQIQILTNTDLFSKRHVKNKKLTDATSRSRGCQYCLFISKLT